MSLSKHAPEDLFTSRINYTELLYGAYSSAKIERNLKVIFPFLGQFEILEFDQAAAKIFAKEKARLKKLGMMMVDMDLMIASITIANKLILITNTTKYFNRGALKIFFLPRNPRTCSGHIHFTSEKRYSFIPVEISTTFATLNLLKWSLGEVINKHEKVCQYDSTISF